MFGPGNCGKHGVHRALTCVECHAKASKSTDTADVLLPEIRVCRECHRTDGGARTACVECHLYHDKAHERDANGALTIQRLTRGRR